MSSLPPEMEALKTRLRSTWTAGDFGQIARHNTVGAEDFISRLGIGPGMKVLDVACGTGNLAVPAARLGAEVTGLDIAPNLLEQARLRAESEGLKLNLDEGDAEQLPYEDGSFDLVMSMFGAMFAPRPERVAAEMARVCRPGGRIAMANWTPEGFVGHMFKTTGRHVAPPQGIPSPMLWGSEEAVRERLGAAVSDLKLTRRTCPLAFEFDEADVVEFFRRYYGPTQRAFEALDDEKQSDLRKDLEQLWRQNNSASGGATRADAEYLEVIATRA